MNTYRTYTWILICAAIGGVAGHFITGLATGVGIAIGAGVGVAISSTNSHRGTRGQAPHTKTALADQTPKNTD